MIQVTMVRSLTGLALAPEEPQDALAGIPRGQHVRVAITVPRTRNSRFMRKYFALLKLAHGNMDESCRALDFDSFRRWMILAAGFFEVMPDGTRLPKSIAFGSMTEDEFERLYNATLNYALLHVLPTGTNRSDVDDAVNELMAFA
jgi:hypothetical protein